MKLSTRGLYEMRALLDLALHQPMLLVKHSRHLQEAYHA
jgi:DNA-binding IscR family transcriptional regulator